MPEYKFEKYNDSKKELPYRNVVNKYNLISKREDYIKQAMQLVLLLSDSFKKEYPCIDADFRLRIKSNRSIEGKILKLELARMEKLSLLRDLSNEEMEDYFGLIEDKFDFNQYNEAEKKVLIQVLKNINVVSKEQVIKIERICDLTTKYDFETRRMLLIGLRNQINNSDRNDKEQLIQKLDEDYGETFFFKFELENLTQEQKEKLESLDDTDKIYDVFGMKGIITNIPDDFETENIKLKSLIEKRKYISSMDDVSNEEKELLEDEIGMEFGKEFLDKFILSQDVKKDYTNSEKRRKSIAKANGYRAEHATIINNENQDYKVEIQMKSAYRERLASFGSAAHDKREGKIRGIPKLPIDTKYIKELEYRVPKYFIIRNKTNTIYRCGLFESTYYYYKKQLADNPRLADALLNSEMLCERVGEDVER